MDGANATNNRILLVMAAILVLGAALFLGLRHRGKIPLDITVAPKEATITLNGQKTGGSPYVAPGKYELAVSRDGFRTYKHTFDVAKGDGRKTFAVALEPQTVAARQIATAQAELYREIEGQGGQAAQAAGENFAKNNPIVSNIPYKTGYYSIDYSKDKSGRLVIQITANAPVGRQVAIEKIRSWGFDPTDYLIEFVGLQNPFAVQGGG